jgi:hydrogenase small subunit
LESISLDYHETLMAAAGHKAEAAKDATLKSHSGKVIVVVEGSIPTKDNGVYCTIGGKTALQIMKEVEPHALAFVSVGTCAAFGGLPKANPNPTGAVAVEDVVRGKPVINLPGCPANPDVLMGLLVHYLVFGRLPDLDMQKRPLFAYGKRIHDTCERRPHFDAGQYTLAFDDFGARNGYCLYKVGCKGPETYNICASRRWNLEASWPVKAGHPCIGCSERDFWDRFTPFYQRLPHVTGFGVEADADLIGKISVGTAAAGIAGHAIYTALARRGGGPGARGMAPAAPAAPPATKKPETPSGGR